MKRIIITTFILNKIIISELSLIGRAKSIKDKLAILPRLLSHHYEINELLSTADLTTKETNNISIDKEQVLNNLIKRDELDMNRKYSPLFKDDNAIEIDTTSLNINEQVELIIKTINKE